MWLYNAQRSSVRCASVRFELTLVPYRCRTFNFLLLTFPRQEARQSGDAAWAASRGEGGDGSASTGSGKRAQSKSVASPLIGVPLGVSQPRVGLALCVAAVEERNGDASVLVGGATVCQLSGDGRGALCAAAVSATAGVLVDARTFPLRFETDCAAIVAWVSGLPDAVVVVIAAGGGSNAAASLGAGLGEEMAKLVYDDGSYAKGGETAGVGKSSRFALVGWKGAGSPKWARRQDQDSGEGRRFALYADLLFIPPSASANRAPEPRQVELKDKMCLSSLRSYHGQATASPREAPPLGGDEGIALPVRGICYSAGEPTVSVGPVIDLIDCAGWTTVLQAPEATADANVLDAEGNNVSPTSAWVVTTAHPAVGGWHDDTVAFDDGAVG